MTGGGTIDAFIPLLMTKKQVAFLLSESIWGVEQLVRQGHLVAYGEGKLAKYKSDEVLAYVKNLRERAS